VCFHRTISNTFMHILIPTLMANCVNCHELVERDTVWQADRQKFFLITTYKSSLPTPAPPDTPFAIALSSCCQSKRAYELAKSRT
jgi:antirestriction protein